MQKCLWVFGENVKILAHFNNGERNNTSHIYTQKKTAAFCGCFTLERDIISQLAQRASPAGFGKLCCYMQTFHTGVSRSLVHENQTKRDSWFWVSVWHSGMQWEAVTQWDAVAQWDAVTQWDAVIHCEITPAESCQNSAGIVPDLVFYCRVTPGMMRDFQKFCRPPPDPPLSRQHPGRISAAFRRHFGSICHTEKEQFPMQPVSICLISR